MKTSNPIPVPEVQLLEPKEGYGARFGISARTVLAGLFLLVLFPGLVYFVVKKSAEQVEKDAYRTLHSIAELKANSVEDWLSEREGDGLAISGSPGYVERVANLIRGNENERQPVRERLKAVMTAYGYDALHLLDTQGRLVLGVGREHSQPLTFNPDLYLSADNEIKRIGPRLEDGIPIVDWFVPLQQTVDGREKRVATLVLHIGTRRLLSRDIETWPIPSDSAEALLLRRDGESVVYLSKLRHRPEMPANLRFPLDTPNLIAATAIHTATQGTAEGKDYRGVAVLAAYQPIKGTDWFIVAKQDLDEVGEPVRELALWVSLFAFLAIATIAVAAIMLWRQTQRAQQLALDAQANQLIRTFYDMPFLGMSISGPETYRRLFVNDCLCTLLGHSREDLLQNSWMEITPPEDIPAILAEMKRMEHGESEACTLEKSYLKKDGGILPVIVNIKAVRNEDRTVRFFAATVQDLTESKRNENEKQQLLIEQQTLLKNATVGIAYVAQRRVISCNRRLEELFGCDPGELIGETTERLYMGYDSFLELGEHASAQMAKATSFSREVQLTRKDGALFWVLLSGRAMDPEHPREGSVWTIIDVNERHQAEMESHKLRQAIEQSPVSVVITNLEGTIEYVNPWFSQMTGYTLEEAIGQNPRILRSDETPPETYVNLWQTLKADELWHGTFRNKKKNGELFWEDATISPMKNDQNVVTHYIAVKVSITERKLIEETQLFLLECEKRFPGEDFFAVLARFLAQKLDMDYVCIDRLVDDGLMAQTMAIYSDHQFEDNVSYALKDTPCGEVAENGVCCTVQGVRHQFPRDTALQAMGAESYVGVPLWGNEGKPIGLIAVIGRRALANPDLAQTVLKIVALRAASELEHGLSEMKQRQAHDKLQVRTTELSTALDEARVADRVKDEFLANISHELRTPLNVVIGLSKLALATSTDSEQRRRLEAVVNSGKNLSGIINDLLDLSKIAAGRLELESITFSLHQLLERNASTMNHKAKEQGVRLLQHVDDDVPDVLIGDPLRLEQILTNLCSNAIKFTSAGRVEVRIAVHAREEGRVCLNMEVEDTGVGISEENIAKLFMPFSQADTSVTRRFGGTGLGLSICKQFSEMMDGSVRATSVVGQGSTFQARVWLGLGDARDLLSEHRDYRKGDGVRYYDAHVLVVEDHPFNREIIHNLLTAVGITPHVASNGQEALDRLSLVGPRAFDLVLMDIQMPVMDGLTATREIRADSRFDALPIIAMTAHAMTHEKAKYMASGMSGHISKPFDTENLYAVLAHWISEEKQQGVSTPPLADTELTTRDFPALRGIDTQDGLSMLSNDAARYRFWLADFAREAPGHAERVRRAIAAGQPELASQSTHTLKGRVGMLGMKGLHPLITALDAALQRSEPVDELLDQWTSAANEICSEIHRVIGQNDPQESPAFDPPAGRTPETLPPSVKHLLLMLKNGDADSDEALTRCLEELQDTDWASHLRHALAHVQRFDFTSAYNILSVNDLS